MNALYINSFALGYVLADGSIKVHYSTHDLSIVRYRNRAQVESHISRLSVDAGCSWVVLTYAEAFDAVNKYGF